MNGFAEDHEQIALAAVGKILLHVQIGIHAGLENGDRTKFVELGGLGLEVEGTADQDVMGPSPSPRMSSVMIQIVPCSGVS